MFGSTTPFGQSSTSPFGSQSVFGQANNVSSNPFAPKPFGSTNPFGSQTGGSIFGGTSTGVFGATQASSPLASTQTFGAASTPAFGSSFGASTPAFGSGSSSFGGSTPFGQKPAFGGAFGSTPSQSSPFGSTFQQTQPAFGSNMFGSSSPFGASSQPGFGASSSPAFGATGSTAFGTMSTSAFGATSTPAFGSANTPTFGSTGSAFGASSAPAFGSGGAFGASSTPGFGSSSTPGFGASNTPGFGAASAPAFGTSSAPSFSFGSSPAFGQTNSAFGSSTFGATPSPSPSPSPFGAQSSPFSAQATTPTFGGNTGFGQAAFGAQQRGGSRVAAYTPTTEVDAGTGQTPGKLESISAMAVYKDKSHEELRWDDYQLGDKGGPNPAGQPAAGGTGFGAPAQTSPFGGTTFNQPATNPFSSTTSSQNLFSNKPAFSSSAPTFSTSAFGTSSTTNPFGATNSPSTSSLFGTPNASPSPFGTSTTSFTSPFGGPTSTPGQPAPFGQGLTNNTQTAGLFQSTAPSLGQTSSGFGQTTSTFGQTSSTFGQTPSFTSNAFGTPTSGFGGNLFNSTPSQPSTSNAVFGQTTPGHQPSQTSSTFSFSNIGQTQPSQVSTGGFGSTTGLFGQNTFGQPSVSQNSTMAAVQPAPAATNPFGTLPTMPQISITRAGGSAPSVQYGISNMPVADKPAPVRVSSLLTSRHLSQRRIRLPARRYHPKNDGPRVPFFSDDEEAPSTPKADALFIPRENPRALVIRPTEQWNSRTASEKSCLQRDINTPVHENGKINGKESTAGLNGSINQDKDKNPVENGHEKERAQPSKSNQKANGVHEDQSTTQKGDSYITFTGHRAGEAAIVYEHGADIEALMPKLRHSDYYTEPRIQELAAKERAEPGFCRRVKDFVVGRHGFGSIKFIGETDVRRLDLESLVQFNNREVIVYMDESKKPPVGQGLNKPAEVTLLNIKCFDKKTGLQYTEGPKVEKYKEMLMKKARDQGAEFVSYDPSKGEWKFRVNHFSRYMLDNIDDEDECGEVGVGITEEEDVAPLVAELKLQLLI